MSKQVSVTTTIFADLAGHQASKNPQGTIPVDFFVSKAKLDMVLRKYVDLKKQDQ